jgi:hypothetical protein
MAHVVKCPYCGKTFDRDKYADFVQVSARRYAHTECHNQHLAQMSQEEKDLMALEEYIKSLLGLDSINARVRKQINDYKNNQNYSYTGILKALTYFYEVKGNSIEKANGGIGIVPYVYQDAYNYYYHIWMAKQTNEVKPIEQYSAPPARVIVIPPPKRVEKKRKLFSFLDEEE